MQPRDQENNSEKEINQDYSNSPEFNNMTEVERQAQFRRQHQQYIEQKMARKKQILKLRRAQFGSSSSDSSDQDIPMGSSSSQQQNHDGQQHSSNQVKQFTSQNKQLKVQTKNNTFHQQKIPVNSLAKKGGQWVKDVLVFDENIISIQNTSCSMKIFNKIKIIAQATMGYPYRVKLNYQCSQILFSPSVGVNQQRSGLPLSYYIFARIIKQKLNSQGIKLKENSVQKIPGVPQSLINNSYKYGKLKKKSQILGKWEERFIVINKDGIFSYKKFNEKYTMHINSGSLKQLWTRFQIQDEFLIIKTMHNSNKTQFGLPLYQILQKNSWLYHFYGAMSKK